MPTFADSPSIDFAQIDKKIDCLYPQMEQDLLRLMAIPSVEEPAAGPGAPFGRPVAEALACALEISARLGLQTTNIDGYMGLADIPGQSEQAIGVLSHLDVVPADPQGWQTPPFAPQVINDRICGRGALDDKGPLVASLYAGIALSSCLAQPLPKTVRFMFGCNEESGCRCLQYYLQKHQPPSRGFSPDAEFPLIIGEKGIIHFALKASWQAETNAPLQLLELKAGSAINIVPNQACAVLQNSGGQLLSPQAGIEIQTTGATITVKASGKAAHASTPEEGDNALTRLWSFLGQLELAPQGAALCLQTLSALFRDNCFGTSLGLGSEDQVSRLTLIPSVMELSKSGCRLLCDMRFPVTKTSAPYREALAKICAAHGLELEILTIQEPLYADPTSPTAAALLKAYRDYTGDFSEPLVIGGGTYAKELPGFLAFGPEFAHTPKLCHQADEYISRQDLLDAAKIYSRAIYQLATLS